MTDDAQLGGGSGDRPPDVAALYDRHAVAVHRFLARRGGTQMADDLLGEVFVLAFEKRATYDAAKAPALPWLYGLAHNILRTELRRRRRETTALDRVGPVAAEDPWLAADERLAAQGRSPELRQALAGLTEADRDVLLLVACEDLTPAEVSTVLRLPPGTARSRLHRARAALRAALDHDFHPQPTVLRTVKEA